MFIPTNQLSIIIQYWRIYSQANTLHRYIYIAFSSYTTNLNNIPWFKHIYLPDWNNTELLYKAFFSTTNIFLTHVLFLLQSIIYEEATTEKLNKSQDPNPRLNQSLANVPHHDPRWTPRTCPLGIRRCCDVNDVDPTSQQLRMPSGDGVASETRYYVGLLLTHSCGCVFLGSHLWCIWESHRRLIACYSESGIYARLLREIVCSLAGWAIMDLTAAADDGPGYALYGRHTPRFYHGETY